MVQLVMFFQSGFKSSLHPLLCFIICVLHFTDLGPVVQSIVSFMSLVRVILLTVLMDSIHSILIYFAEKM